MWDAVVIGLGGVGSFAIRALTRQSQKVLGLERFTRCHAFGSSHGGSRIYRHAYFEHANYVPLIQYSTREFQHLQDSSGSELLQECGTLVVEEANGPVIASCTASAQQHGIPVENLTTNDLKQRYPQFCYDENMVGLLEPAASGFVRPERAIEAALEYAEAGGATLWEKTVVQSIQEVSDDNGQTHVEVLVQRRGETDQEEETLITARSVIVAGGAWTAMLLPSWKPYLKVTRQLQGWIDVSSSDEPDLYNPQNLPCWYMSSPKLQLPMYGIPADPHSDTPHWIKVGLHKRDVSVHPNDSSHSLNLDEWMELQAAGRTFVRDSDDLPWPTAKPCLYTMTPDEHFLVGRPNGCQCTYAAAGLSGHGFKMTPALGQVMADWALKGESALNVDFLAPSRFGI